MIEKSHIPIHEQNHKGRRDPQGLLPDMADSNMEEKGKCIGPNEVHPHKTVGCQAM